MHRILIFNDTFEAGGTEVLLVDILNHLSKKESDVTLMLPQQSNENSLLSRVSSQIKVQYLYSSNVSHYRRKLEENIMVFCPFLYRRMKKIKASDYDVVVCFKDSLYARFLSGMDGIRVLWVHNMMYRRGYEAHSLKDRLSIWLNKLQLKKVEKSYQKFDKVICVSEACRDAYINIVFKKKRIEQDIIVLYNALDFAKIITLSGESIENLEQGVIKFLLITRNSPEKRIDRLISASARLYEEGYDFRVYVLGEYGGGQMLDKIKYLGLTEKIYCVGRVDNPYPYIAQSNWSLCVSERESFSLSLLESMILKIPVITTDCGGPANIIERGKYGILVDNSTEGVYRGMKKVLDDTTLSVKYSAHLNEALDRFSYTGWLKKIDEMLNLN